MWDKSSTRTSNRLGENLKANFLAIIFRNFFLENGYRKPRSDYGIVIYVNKMLCHIWKVDLRWLISKLWRHKMEMSASWRHRLLPFSTKTLLKIPLKTELKALKLNSQFRFSTIELVKRDADHYYGALLPNSQRISLFYNRNKFSHNETLIRRFLIGHFHSQLESFTATSWNYRAS